MTGFDPWSEIRGHEARNRQHSENSARQAQAVGFVSTTGWGEFEFPDEIGFGVAFVEQPSVAHGHSIDTDDLIPLRFPRCYGGVSRWRQNTDGFYVGAWVYTVVDTRSPEDITGMPTIIPNYSISHCFTFGGVAMKVIPADLLAYNARP